VQGVALVGAAIVDGDQASVGASHRELAPIHGDRDEPLGGQLPHGQDVAPVPAHAPITPQTPTGPTLHANTSWAP
jgi:hypothetical protein